METDRNSRLLSWGLAALAALCYPLAASGETGNYQDGEACFEWTEADGACPDADTAFGLLVSSDPGCEIDAVTGGGVLDADGCCYPVELFCEDIIDGGCQ